MGCPAVRYQPVLYFLCLKLMAESRMLNASIHKPMFLDGHYLWYLLNKETIFLHKVNKNIKGVKLMKSITYYLNKYRDKLI